MSEVDQVPRSYRSKPILIENHRWDPVTGVTSSLLGTTSDIVQSSTGIFLKPAEEYRKGRSRSAAPGSRKPTSTSTSRPQSRQPSPTRSSSDTISTIHNAQLPPTAPTSAPNDQQPFLPPQEPSPTSRPNVAGSMALASSKSLGKFFSSYTKGVLVDMPLATAEGFRSLPRLWGSEVPSYGNVTDWKSGAVVAGKSFALGISDGLRDLGREPAEGMAKEGAWGALKGVAKGGGSLVSKTVSGSLGLVAYPGQGITKSLWALTHGETGKKVVEAKRVEGQWRAGSADERTRHAVLREYYNANVGGK